MSDFETDMEPKTNEDQGLDDCRSPTGTIRRVPSLETSASPLTDRSGEGKLERGDDVCEIESDGTQEGNDTKGQGKPSYSHVVKSGTTPGNAEGDSNLGLLPPSTPVRSNPYQQQLHSQQQYLTAPPSVNLARTSRSASRTKPAPPFTPGVASRQVSYADRGAKASRSLSRVRRTDGMMGDAMGALQREGDVYSDEEYDAEPRRRFLQQSTPQRPDLRKAATTAALSRRERRNEDDDDDDDDRTLGQDDEVLIRDRGEDLIRKRMRERKKAKRLASTSANNAAREVRARDFANYPATQPQTPYLASNDGYNDQSFFGGSLSSVPPTPRMNANDKRAGSVGRATSTSRNRIGGPIGTSASTPGLGNLPTDPASYNYFPTYSSKGDTTAFSAGSRPGPLRQQQQQPPQQPSSYEEDAVEEISTPTALEATVPANAVESTVGNPASSSVSAVDWDFLGPSGRENAPRQSRQPYNTSSLASRGQSRAPSVVSDVISDVVRQAEERSSARGGDSRRMSEDGEDDEDEGIEDGDDIGEDDEGESGDEDDEDEDEEGVTMRDRQDAINIEHPFGLPIWKPALYKKSRSVTRNAEKALHSIPSAAAERHLLPGNILWTLVFGWWLALLCFILAILVFAIEFVTSGGRIRARVSGEMAYANTIAGLGWYLGWPFGKYVEGKGVFVPPHDEEEGSEGDAEESDSDRTQNQQIGPSADVQRQEQGLRTPEPSSSRPKSNESAKPTVSASPSATVLSPASERQQLLPKATRPAHAQAHGVTFGGVNNGQARESLYGAINTTGSKAPEGSFRHKRGTILSRLIGGAAYWIAFCGVIAPVLGIICLLCWGGVITIPMAKLTWKLLKLMALRPLEIKFRSAPKVIEVVNTTGPSSSDNDRAGQDLANGNAASSGSPNGHPVLRPARLKAGQLAPTAGPDSTVLLCTYRAIGFGLYKYTVGGVNIIFVNLLPLVFFTIFDGFVLLPAVERAEHRGERINPVLAFIASQALIFILSLASVIPLSYFIGMAVASISAQSSIGMGAVINATFGSIIEIILYGIALTQGKGKLVEGSIVGSILAGVLLMPGLSMVSGAFKRKEQRFNAKSAGVTSTMLIMAIIGTLTPTLFYQTYGSFELKCDGCPDTPPIVVHDEFSLDILEGQSQPWHCERCFYVHPDPAHDVFYQEQVKGLMYICASILVLAYLIGLWFSLRTHASQIWQNPQQLMKLDEVPAGAMHPAHRTTVYQRLTPQAVMQQLLPTVKPLDQTPASAPAITRRNARSEVQPFRSPGRRSRQPSYAGRLDYGQPVSKPQRTASLLSSVSQTPLLNATPRMSSQGAQQHRPNNNELSDLQLPPHIEGEAFNTEEFTRAVAVATVNALKSHENAVAREWRQAKAAALPPIDGIAPPATAASGEQEGGHGGHEGPSWSRTVSTCVLLGCTVLYAIIAEILVDVVDVVLQGSGIDEKFLGVSLFALVPNTTEFMNAISFALGGNIALSMEIGSAYALQVCLLQIPAMVAFSAFYDPGKMGQMVDTFTLIFPRWDVISIILSIFLLTYTYIEARSNYHRGSMLVLSYIVLAAGFYFAPGGGAVGNGDPSLLAFLVRSVKNA
ncbi:hypothetical protein QFC22_000088 [Naganishia vaughanmartiniae]|uniref:Uncharacterized protein n=1 Tax=Naganishia vaughanmartiniae TaxID=1424756 RepID=A0ACC2XNV6_9TREE|nr:hypothetical protein QFC22_000088 [Naganishia vaughanmartiniae]